MIYKILLTLFCTCVFAMIPESDIARLNKDIFSADESNYDDLKVYFTDDAWLRFSTALLRSGNLSSLTKNKMRTNVAFLGILEAKKIDDKQIIKSKILVTYQKSIIMDLRHLRKLILILKKVKFLQCLDLMELVKQHL